MTQEIENPMSTRSIPLSKGKIALVDEDDYERVIQYKWSYHAQRDKQYALRRDYKTHPIRTIYLHRFIMNAPTGLEVDHINHETLDCRKANLRLATRRQNSQNQKKPNRKDRTSTYKGVSRVYGNKWKAFITINGKLKYIGCFPDEQSAARAYNNAAIAAFGEYAHINIIVEVEK